MSESAQRRVIRVAWALVVDKVIEYWLAISITTIAGGGMTYLASISKWLEAYGPVAWGLVGLGTILVVSLIYFLWGWGKSYFAIAAYTKAIASTSTINVLSPLHQDERINLSSFFHPYYRPTENARFENCDLMGPAFIVVQACQFLHGGFTECEIVIIRTDRPIRGAMVFRFCTFLRSRLYRVTFLMPHEQYRMLPEEMRIKVPVISDGRVGDL